MDEKKAIEVLDVLCKSMGNMQEYREALVLAVSALKKQVPQKPVIKPDKYADVVLHYYCPACGRYFGQAGVHSVILFNKERFCQGEKCGQAIDWDTNNIRE